MRILYRVLGFLFTALGIVGIFLPLVPTTGPLLLAVWFFAKSSPRWRDWLVQHPVLGKYVQELWVRRGLTRKSKRRAIVAMSAVMLLSAVVLPSPIVRLSLGGAWLVAAGVILSRKTLPELPPEAAQALKMPMENP